MIRLVGSSRHTWLPCCHDTFWSPISVIPLVLKHVNFGCSRSSVTTLQVKLLYMSTRLCHITKWTWNCVFFGGKGYKWATQRSVTPLVHLTSKPCEQNELVTGSSSMQWIMRLHPYSRP
jgi:hypothetical protein